MRGFVFNLKRRRNFSSIYGKPILRLSRLSQQIRRYFSAFFFAFVFAIGMLMGSLSARSADIITLEKLDFLFATNLSARIEQSVLATFSASFASDFLFLAFVFLCGLAPWGMAVIYFVPAFKGFGTGLSAGYLFVTYGFKGVGFYLLVILGGTFIFCFALIIQCIQANALSCKIARMVFKSSVSEETVSVSAKNYLIRSLYLLILTTIAAFVDMFLWTAFAHLFF